MIHLRSSSALPSQVHEVLADLPQKYVGRASLSRGSFRNRSLSGGGSRQAHGVREGMTKEPKIRTTPALDGIVKIITVTYGNPKASFGSIASK